MFWTNALKYTFPPQYLEPIYDSFTGVVEKMKIRFKINKKETDIRHEAAVQQQPKPEEVDIQIQIDDKNVYKQKRYNFPNNNVNHIVNDEIM